MASFVRKISAQALDVRLITLLPGDVVTVKLIPENTDGTRGAVKWEMGGVSWSIRPIVDGNPVNVAVDYSLYQEGEEDWVPHVDSPFEEAKQENEWGRCDRIRFTHNGNANCYVTVASNGKYSLDGTG